MTVPQTLHSLLNEALVKVDAEGGSIMFVEPPVPGGSDEQRGRRLGYRARVGPPRPSGGSATEFYVGDQSLAGQVAESGKPQSVDYATTDRRVQRSSYPPNFDSLLVVPIRREQQIIGVLCADHSASSHFTPDHEGTLCRFARRIARTTDAPSILSVLGHVSSRLMASESPGALQRDLAKILEQLRPALAADLVTLYLYDAGTGTFQVGAGWPLGDGKFLHQGLMQNDVKPGDRQYQIVNKKCPEYSFPTEQERNAPSEKEEGNFVKREQVTSVAAVPLVCQVWKGQGCTNEAVGVMFINHCRHDDDDDTDRPHEFTTEERAAIETVAAVIAATIREHREREAAQRKQSVFFGRIHSDLGPLLDDRGDMSLEKALLDDPIEAFVLALDIRSSTELMRNVTQPVHYVDFITEIEQSLRQVLTKEYAIVDKFTGDGMLGLFPLRFSGREAILRCLRAAARCHKAFDAIYKQHRAHFQVAIRSGLGIGIDYGMATVRKSGHELILVGQPVVYACRLANGAAGRTLLNVQAAEQLVGIQGNRDCLTEALLEIKHGEPISVYALERPARFPTGAVPEVMKEYCGFGRCPL